MSCDDRITSLENRHDGGPNAVSLGYCEKVVGRASYSGNETDVTVLGTAGPEAVQNTGLTRFRQP
jgi:hypothetical protein